LWAAVPVGIRNDRSAMREGRRRATSNEAAEREMWDRLPVALCRTTLDGSLLDVNRAFVECLRSPGRESLLLNRTLSLYVDSSDRARWLELVQAHGIVRGFETQMRRVDGTTFWARLNVRSQAAAGGDPIVYEALIEDITDHRRAERLLQASELRYRRLFEAAKDGILILDAASAEIVDVNPFLCELLGLSREEVLGRKVWEIGPFKDVPASKVNFRELQQAGSIRYEDLPLESAKGVKIAVEFVSNVYLVDGEKVIQCNVRDITERKLAAEKQAVLARATEQASEAIIITDPRGAIEYVNPAFERISGWTCQEAMGRNPRILKSGTQDDAFYRQMWEVLARGEAWTGRFVNRRKDGGLFEEEASISPVRDAAGQVVNYVAVKRDITKERRLEEQLLQAQRMEAVGRLAGGVAHDFNNLLAVITGFGELVHKKLADDDPLKGKVAQILKAADRAAGLTRQLLAFGRKQVLQPRILDLNDVVSAVDKMLRFGFGERIEIAALLQPHLGNVKADPGQIEQVLMNLAVNARDAMPEGGRITIETRNVDLGAEDEAADVPARPGPYVLLAVTDTGVGMEAATQARVFEPFFSTKEVGKGTGLGLSTVYGIVKQSGGDIFLESEVGVGTTFKIYLPRVDEPAPLAIEARKRPLRRGAETVLLVEDEALLREMLLETIESNGYSVLVARDGPEALQIAGAHAGPIPIMVTDVVMPGMTGPKLVDLFARTRPEMKVLYISGYSDESVSRNSLTGPGRAFLSKPFGPEALLRRVRESLDAS
jgi:two-component system, cell cycle sensor histidine kinase and response regulator CckA